MSDPYWNNFKPTYETIRKERSKEKLKTIIFFTSAIFIGLLIAGGMVGCTITLDKNICIQSTGGMTMQHRYLIIGGCQVLTKQAGWIPLENFRALD